MRKLTSWNHKWRCGTEISRGRLGSEGTVMPLKRIWSILFCLSHAIHWKLCPHKVAIRSSRNLIGWQTSRYQPQRPEAPFLSALAPPLSHLGLHPIHLLYLFRVLFLSGFPFKFHCRRQLATSLTKITSQQDKLLYVRGPRHRLSICSINALLNVLLHLLILD